MVPRGSSRYPKRVPRSSLPWPRASTPWPENVTDLLSNRTTLLAGISHDLRTPLTRMRFALEMLPASVDEKLVERFERNLAAMEELIADALRFSRGAGEAPSQVEFRDYLKTVLRDVDEDLDIEWRNTPPQLVEIATGAFQRVVANLVRNAQQHGRGARLAVDYDGDLVVQVIDDGPGIPPEDRERVFRPFFPPRRFAQPCDGRQRLGPRDRRPALRSTRLARPPAQ